MSHHRDNGPPCPTETIIFVTHVEGDRDYLKIWGQQDMHTVACVERYIFPLVEQFSQGYGCPSKTNPPIIGALCCGRFKNDGYFRAKILNVRHDGMIVVHFIDYGNIEVLPPNDVHLLSNIPILEPLQTYPPMATEFTLFQVLPINGVWENRVIETIKSILCYNEFRALVSNAGNNNCLVKLWYNNEDFSELLIRRHLALPVNLQDACRIKSFPQPEMVQVPMYQQQTEGNMSNFATMPMMQNVNMNQNTNVQGMYRKTPPGVTQHKYIAPQLSPPTQEALVFKSRVLDVSTMHNVIVSCVEDGPQKFSVQVQSTTEILSHLMKEINNRPKKPLEEPPLPGSVCLGYTEGRILCRAVVMSVMELKCKLYYVDFGHTEVLPYTDIFQLPPEFINPKVLSIRFTLSGLKELNITQEMKDYFKKLVTRKLLCLHVRPPEGPPLIQYGDLYDNGVNIKDMLKEAFPAPVTVPIMYSYPQLRQLSKNVQEMVHVSFVESCEKFFVQLDSGIKSLESIMTVLAQYAKTASAFNMAQLKVGLPCAALYDSEWYRAQVLDINGDKVKVVYVDYGNEEMLSIMSLRVIRDDLVKALPAQAIKCALNGYEVLSSDQEVVNHFERLTIEKRFFMKVVASQPHGLLVDLFEFDNENRSMRSVHPQLLNNLFCDKTENSLSSQNEEIQHHPKALNLYNSPRSGTNIEANLAHQQGVQLKNITARDDKDKKSNTNSWNRNQNSRLGPENRPKTWRDKRPTVNDEWSPEKQYDNRRERIATDFQRDNSQNDRFAKEETANSRSYNKYDKNETDTSGRRSYNKYDKSEMDTPNRRSYNRYDKSETDVPNRSGRENFRNDRSRFPTNESKFSRNSTADKIPNDKDSDTSPKGNDNREKGGFNRSGRMEKRDSGVSNRLQAPKWNDRNNDRFGYNKITRVNGDCSNMGSSNLKNKENYTSNISYNQENVCESWNTNNVNTKLQSNIVANEGSQFVPTSITLGTAKNCEVVFINGPTDFFVQLNPECLELEPVMNSITEAYEKGGETMQAFEAKCGTCCVAQYEEDHKWYRAVINSVEGNNATVTFIDYGNTELVDFTKIKVIREDFLKLPMQAIQCKLLGFTNIENKDAEYASFLKRTEGKLLEIEFVIEENKIYEVLLREASSTNYINEEFCTDVNLTKAKEAALSKKMPSSKTPKKAHVAPDYVTFNSRWQTTSYEPESKHNVIITWFINPNKFYCQTLTQEAEFKMMMNEIQQTYASRESIRHKLEVGEPVIAIFSEDGALYRAEVLKNNAQKGYIVQYIDFGNCATVKQQNIYPVEKIFMQLPKLAAQCTLKNIVPNNNLNWSEVNNDALDTCFDGDKYECIFHNFGDGQYTISLSHDEQDVGKVLVEKNLAAFAEKPQSIEATTEIEVEAEVKVNEGLTPQEPNIEVTALNEVEKVDISLLSGQTLMMKVSSVESTTRLYVQLPSASKCEHIVERYMADKNAEVMPRLSYREMYLGAGCLVNANGTWKRAVVINCSRLVGSFDVKLIDTGAYDEILDNALALPGALAAMQKQALECSLQDAQVSAEADKQLKELLEGKEVFVYVAEVDDSRLIVKLYDLHGNGIMNRNESDKAISTVCPMPILSSTHKVSVSYAAVLEDHTVEIWLQRDSDYELNDKLSKDLQYYSNFGQRLEPEVNRLCAAKSTTDDCWYRGKIVSCTETTAYVHYIDYGNMEEISLDFIMVLEPQFHEPHQLAVNATLSVALAGTEIEQILQTHLIDKEFTAIFYNVHKKWIVELFENDEKITDRFRSLNLIMEEDVAPQPLSLTQEPSPTTHKFDALVSHVDSPSQFWLQRVDKSAALNELQTKIQLEVSSLPQIDGIPEEGTWCVSIYSFDHNWYRAEVLDADEDITTVRFIDYGNTDVIVKADRIRQMPDTWKNIERYAMKCKLDVIPVGTEDWDEAACDILGNLAMSTDTVQAVIVADTVPKRVELFANGKSLSETLVEEKYAVIVTPEQAELVDEEIVDIELDPHSAFVCHINSPSEFWMQEEKSVADLEVMTDRFMVADMFSRVDIVSEGLLCVAKYPEDSQWYRARVLSHDDNSTRVIFVDYGNSSVSTEIRALPEDLAGIPPLSRKCCLELPPHVKDWSKEACNKFVELAADGATIFILDVLKEQEISTVKLTLDAQNVTDILASLCEQQLPEERLPPLGEENSPNVVVSHINSPDEFWIQTESSISELEVMSDRLRDAESFVKLSPIAIDSVCAALYPEDECWYRAKIFALCEEGAEVLYIDYGNYATTDKLRVLPQDIVNIPALSKQCSLEKPEHIDVWSEQACDKFKELAAEGATMFQFETLNDDARPTRVQLSLNGRNVVELLQTECENNVLQVEETIEAEDEDTISTTEKQSEFVVNETVSRDNDPIEITQEIVSDVGEAAKPQLTFNQIVPDTNLLCATNQAGPNLEDLIDDDVISKSFDDSDVGKELMTLNQIIPNTNSLCTNQAEHKLGDLINDDVIVKSLDDSDVGKELTEEQPRHMLTRDEIEEVNKKPEAAAPEYTSEMSEVSDLSAADATCLVESSSVVTELTVDDIIGNMARDNAEDSEINDVNLSITDKPEFVVEGDVDEQPKLVSDLQSTNINKLLVLTHTNVKILRNATPDEQHELCSQVHYEHTKKSADVPLEEPATVYEKILDVQFSADQAKEENATQPLKRQNPNKLLDDASMTNNTWCLPQEHANPVEEQKASSTEDETRGNATKNLQETSKSADLNLKSISTVAAVPLSSVTKTDPCEQRRSMGSRRRSEDKIVPGCISRGESPVPEAAMYSLAPKTEKPAASVASTLQPVADSAKEEDEKLTVSVESNIP